MTCAFESHGGYHFDWPTHSIAQDADFLNLSCQLESGVGYQIHCSILHYLLLYGDEISSELEQSQLVRKIQNRLLSGSPTCLVYWLYFGSPLGDGMEAGETVAAYGDCASWKRDQD
jgi:hypothetical protein